MCDLRRLKEGRTRPVQIARARLDVTECQEDDEAAVRHGLTRAIEHGQSHAIVARGFLVCKRPSGLACGPLGVIDGLGMNQAGVDFAGGNSPVLGGRNEMKGQLRQVGIRGPRVELLEDLANPSMQTNALSGRQLVVERLTHKVV